MWCQIMLQQLSLLGFRPTAANFSALAVQRNNVPLPEIVAVICSLRITRNRTPIARVTRRAAGTVFVIPRRRAGEIFEASPGRSITVGELLVASIWISQIASRKNCSRYFFDQLCSRIRSGKIVTTGDISCAYQDRVGSLFADSSHHQYFELPRLSCREEQLVRLGIKGHSLRPRHGLHALHTRLLLRTVLINHRDRAFAVGCENQVRFWV